MYYPARASSDVASSLAPSPGRRTCRPLAAVYSGLFRPLLRPARSPSEGPAAPAEAAAVPILQQLPAARSHPGGRVRAAADAEMVEYRSASVAVPPMAKPVVISESARGASRQLD